LSLWILRLTVVNTAQSDLQIHCNPCQNPNGSFCGNAKVHPKIHMEFQGTLNSQEIVTENIGGGYTYPGFRIYYNVAVIKTLFYWHEDRHLVQWN
jgi:hypothetical protein